LEWHRGKVNNLREILKEKGKPQMAQITLMKIMKE
jgi:hypothetical protein